MTVDITNKDGREACWAARDKFWNCMAEKNEDVSKCQAERKIFEKDCTKAWVRKIRKYKTVQIDFILFNLFIKIF
jgi:hypothetical protein